MIIQHERQFCNNDKSKTLIANVEAKKSFNRGKGNYQGSKNTSKVCTHCGRTDHTVETCYKKHGFPLNWQRNVSNISSPNEETEEQKEDDSKTIGITKDQYEHTSQHGWKVPSLS